MRVEGTLLNYDELCLGIDMMCGEDEAGQFEKPPFWYHFITYDRPEGIIEEAEVR